MPLTIINHVLAATLVVTWLAASFSLIWSIFFMVKMGFQFKNPGDAFSRKTIWNPLNVLFTPVLLSTSGLRSRRLFIFGVMAFSTSITLAAVAGGVIWILNKP